MTTTTTTSSRRKRNSGGGIFHWIYYWFVEASWFEWWRLDIVDAQYLEEAQCQYLDRQHTMEEVYATLFRTPQNYYKRHGDLCLMQAEQQCAVESPYYFPSSHVDDHNDIEMNKIVDDHIEKEKQEAEREVAAHHASSSTEIPVPSYDDVMTSINVMQHKQKPDLDVDGGDDVNSDDDDVDDDDLSVTRIINIESCRQPLGRQHPAITTANNNNNNKIKHRSHHHYGVRFDEGIPIDAVTTTTTTTTDKSTTITGTKSPIRNMTMEKEKKTMKVAATPTTKGSGSLSPTNKKVRNGIKALSNHLQQRVLMISPSTTSNSTTLSTATTTVTTATTSTECDDRKFVTNHRPSRLLPPPPPPFVHHHQDDDVSDDDGHGLDFYDSNEYDDAPLPTTGGVGVVVGGGGGNDASTTLVDVSDDLVDNNNVKSTIMMDDDDDSSVAVNSPNNEIVVGDDRT
jgi:hypothetical protein